MKTIKATAILIMICMSNYAIGQQKMINKTEQELMKTYLIEREIPEAGMLDAEQLKNISKASCSVLKEMGSAKIQWMHSYITEDKVYCLYKAISTEAINEHAKKGGFPVNRITELSTIINPETAKHKPKNK